jgi:DNA-binding Lrp family transcriptional regulator
MQPAENLDTLDRRILQRLQTDSRAPCTCRPRSASAATGGWKSAA